MKKPILATYAINAGLGVMTEEDARILDVLYIGFGRPSFSKLDIRELTNIGRLDTIRQYNPALKIMLSLGGASEGGFSESTSSEAKTDELVKNIVDVVKQYNLDGIDVDWEYPTINGNQAEKQAHTYLLKRLREELDGIDPQRKYYVSIAAGTKTWYFNITELSDSIQYLDYVNLMTYDINAGSQYTLHHACPYKMSTDLPDAGEGSVEENIDVFVRNGVSPDKLIVGAAFYGRKWDNVRGGENGLFAFAGEPSGYAPDYTGLKQDYIDKNGYVRYWDDDAKAPYLFNGSTFITYDDAQSLKHKCKLVLDKKIAGIMIWHYSADMTHELLSVIKKELSGN